MGGRGSSSGSGRSNDSPIGNEEPVEIINRKSWSGGNRWKYTMLKAEHVGGGEIKVDYADVERYEQINRNTTEAHIKLKAGFYNEMGWRDIIIHNLDMSKVTRASGRTYEIKEILKAEGFRWDPKLKQWYRPL